MIDYEFVIKPILVRVCGESVFGLNYNNSLSLWNFEPTRWISPSRLMLRSSWTLITTSATEPNISPN